MWISLGLFYLEYVEFLGCVDLCLSANLGCFYHYYYYVLIDERVRERERNINLLFHLFMYSLVDSWPGIEPEPWCTRRNSNQLSYPARAGYYFLKYFFLSPFLCHHFRNSLMNMLAYLMISLRSLRFCSSFLIFVPPAQ